MIIRIYFTRRTERRPILFDIATVRSNKDPPFAIAFAQETVDGMRKALAETDAEFAPEGKPLRGCPCIEYRLRIHKREGVFFWDGPVVTCDAGQRVATVNAANTIRKIFADIEAGKANENESERKEST